MSKHKWVEVTDASEGRKIWVNMSKANAIHEQMEFIPAEKSYTKIQFEKSVLRFVKETPAEILAIASSVVPGSGRVDV